MRKLFIICLLNIAIAANAGNGNRNSKGNGGNGNHYGWNNKNESGNPGEVGGDPDENINVPFDDHYLPVLITGSVGYGYWMNRKRKLQIN